MLQRLICIVMVKASNSSHNTTRKKEFHVRLRAMNTFCCGLTSILLISHILEVIDIDLRPRFCNPGRPYYDSYMRWFHQLIAIIPTVLLLTVLG